MGLTTIDSNNVFQKDVIGNVRTAQEDSHDMATLTPNGDVFVVCDGMGGHVGGKQASSIAVKSILEYLKKEKYANPLQALDGALQFANMQILGYANEHPELKGMGTTACILLLQNDEAYIAHVGDSRIYLYLGKEKQLHRITKDHSFVQTLVDSGKISDEEAENHPNKNRILKALGIKPDLEPAFSLKPVLPKNGDIFLICSDGLSGMIPDSNIKTALSSNATIVQKGDLLINLALRNGGLDNITLQLVQISGSPYKKSVFESFNPNATPKGRTGRLKKKLICAVAVVAILVICVGGWYGYKKYQERNISDQIQKIEKEINTAKTDLDTAEKEFKNVKKELDRYIADKKNESVKEQEKAVAIKQKMLSEKQYKLDDLQKKLQELQKIQTPQK